VDLISPTRTARDANLRRKDLGTGKLDYQVTDRFGLKRVRQDWRRLPHL
jgi:hypothetical protein